jgi:hypothetical protein
MVLIATLFAALCTSVIGRDGWTAVLIAAALMVIILSLAVSPPMVSW